MYLRFILNGSHGLIYRAVEGVSGVGIMKSTFAIASLVALGLAMPTLAKDNSDKKADQPKEKKICRTESVTGSLTGKRRICMTKEEWDQLAANSKDKVDRYASRASGTPGLGADPTKPQ